MSRSNLALARPYTKPEINVNNKDNIQQSSKKQKQEVIQTWEKILYLASVVICVILSIILLSGYAKVTQLDVSINRVSLETQRLEKDNLSLKMKISHSKSIDNIQKYSEANGLEYISSVPIQP